MKNIILSLFAISLLWFGSCNPETGNTPQGPYINLSAYTLEFGNNGGYEIITVETNLPRIAATCDAGEWCTATLDGGSVIVNVKANSEPGGRTATIRVKGEGAFQTVTVKQNEIPVNAIADDIQIPVEGATAAFHNPGNEIEKSFDGDYQTYFMSHWSATTFPFDVVYEFTGASSMDYFIYYPRGTASGTGTNGLLGGVEVWYATKGNPAFTKYGDYDFQMGSSAQKVEFSPALTNPTRIKLVLSRGMGNGGTYAAIGEMEFFRKNPVAFDYASVFTDPSCSQLKAGITGDRIDAIDNAFFKYLARAIYDGEYDLESRVREYRARQHPGIMAGVNKTERYSLLDNPAGIYVEAGDELVVLAADFGRAAISLQAIDLSTGGAGTKTAYALSKGVNKLKITSKGLLYVLYHTTDDTALPVKINFVTGKINGYFDKAKHTADDWRKMLDKTIGPYFDVVGEYAHLTFPVSDFIKHTPDGRALIDTYDRLVYLEMEFMGLVKYDKMFKNRMYFHIDTNPDAAYMYASAYRTAYSAATMPVVCGLAKPGANYWGPAHEAGHINQTRPGLKWQGTTEVTNNIYSLYVQTSFGAASRLVTDNVYGKYVANPGANTILGGGLAHAEGNIWEKLVPFWQLKLYLMDVLGKTDFYKDLFEHYRVTPDLVAGSSTDGVYQLDFVRNVCRVANLDLTAFFEKWGFLRAVDLNIDDYGNRKFVITPRQVDDLKAEIAAANYPKPAHNDIYMITDLNVGNYKK